MFGSRPLILDEKYIGLGITLLDSWCPVDRRLLCPGLAVVRPYLKP